MERLGARRLCAVVAFAALAVGGALTAGTVASRAPAAARPATSGSLDLRFNLQRFQLVHHGKRLRARGNVVATYREAGVVRATSTQAIVLTVQQGATCRVLHLELGELRLELLGLIVHLTAADSDRIVLDISAAPTGVLGKLFCQLVGSLENGKVKKASKTTRRLNAVMRNRYSGGVMNVSVPLSAQQQQQQPGPEGQCRVLNLVLGPLYLDLLGLIVQLNKVELDISANPVGLLGTLFCQLAGGPSTTTATTATTGTTGTTGTTTTGPSG